MEIKSGTKLGEFEFRHHLATGGFGQVWEGFDCTLNRPVAIKRLLSKAFGKVDKAELIEEARRVGSLSHPNVVIIHHVVESNDEVFIIMELLSGGSLHDRLREHSKTTRWIAAADGLRLIRDILRGLEAAHSFEGGAIIHRDLKPQNILFDRGDNAKIVDFGLAAVGEVGALATAERAISLEHEGTWGYKSPEQLNGLKLDRRSDLFNVGLIGYLIFSAMHPFTDERFLFTHREMVLRPYRQLEPIGAKSLPTELSEFVIRLLNSDPANRFDSATQALSEFENVEAAFRDLLQDRCLKLHDALLWDNTPEVIDSNDLATGISLLKQAGFYPQAKLLYEKGGLDLSQLSSAARNRVNEDYATCGRRVEKKDIV